METKNGNLYVHQADRLVADLEVLGRSTSGTLIMSKDLKPLVEATLRILDFSYGIKNRHSFAVSEIFRIAQNRRYDDQLDGSILLSIAALLQIVFRNFDN